jgi:hypothetical protein
MPPFGGPIPPSMSPAPPGAGPATPPHGNPGAASHGMGGIKVALDALQKALPTIPMGTELHNSVIDAIKKIGQHMSEMQASPQMGMQNLLQMIAAKMKEQQGAGAAPPGAGGPPGGAPPPMMAPPPPPGGGAPPGM